MGLRIHVYRNPGFPDCTNGGISGRYRQLTLVNAEGPSEPTDDAPAVLLTNHVWDVLSVVPAVKNDDGEWEPMKPAGLLGPMMGGNYAATPDSRFTEACRELLHQERPYGFHGAVAIHDRFETQATYDALTRD